MSKKGSDMNILKNHSGNEDGSVVVIVIIILALLTIVGVSATNMSTTEQKIAGNDKSHKIAFYQVESAPYGMAKWVTRILDEDRLSQDIDGEGDGAAGKTRFKYLNEDSDEMMSEVYNFDHEDNEYDDLQFTMTSGVKGSDGVSRTVTSTVNAYLNKHRTSHDRGGGAEFGMGVRGVGEQELVKIPFWFSSYTASGGGARAAMSAEYLKMLGVPGGL